LFWGAVAEAGSASPPERDRRYRSLGSNEPRVVEQRAPPPLACVAHAAPIETVECDQPRTHRRVIVN